MSKLEQIHAALGHSCWTELPRTGVLVLVLVMSGVMSTARGADAGNGASLLAQAASRPAPSPGATDLDALIKAAKAEGEVVFYSSPLEGVARRFADAFNARYGMKASYVRLGGSSLMQRFSSEAESGNFGADILLIGTGATALAADGVAKGWIERIAQAGLPILKADTFPRRFLTGASAVVAIYPWVIAYNTDKVKGADIPRDWTDALHPKWKGQVLVVDARTAEVYTPLWSILLDKYGESIFTQFRAQNPRNFSGMAPAVQALGAGEGAILVPTTVSATQGLKDKGAPIDTVSPDYTSGAEIHVLLVAPAKAKHPNAARLMANYVMSAEGNKVFNDDPGGFTIYDTTRLPRDFQLTPPGNAARRDQIFKLLGLP